VDERVVGQRSERLEPDGLASGLLPAGLEIDTALDVPEVDRAAMGEELRRRVLDVSQQLGHAREGLRVRRRRHRVLVVQALRGLLEGGDHRQDRLTVLDRRHPAGRERVAVTHRLDGEPDGMAVVPGAHEVGVQRVDPARRGPVCRAPATATGRPDGPPRGDDRLGEHLAAEHAAVRLPLAPADEDRRGGLPELGLLVTGGAVDADAGSADVVEVQHVQQVRHRVESPSRVGVHSERLVRTV